MSRELTRGEMLNRDRIDWEKCQRSRLIETTRRNRHERATLSSNVDTFAAAADIANVRLSKEDMKKLLCAFSDLGYSLKI